VIGIIKATFKDFFEDECLTRAAALAYFTIFSLAPLIVLVLWLIGAVWDPTTIREAIEGQFAQMVGPGAAEQIHTMIESANQPGEGDVLAVVLGAAGLLFGASGAVVQLQTALNRAWEVAPDPAQGGVKNFIAKRTLSLAMVLGIAFLLLASLLVTAALTAFGDALGTWLGGISEYVLYPLQWAISFVVIAGLFALLFRVLPDAEIAWRDALVGGAVTALLFVAGKFAIGAYLGQSDPGEGFGAAGALAVLLVWIYYAAAIVLLGAEFTQVWAQHRGGGIEPEEGAVRVVEEQRRVPRVAPER
jgi:membrane protein